MLSGCSDKKRPESVLLRDFNLGEIVERMNVPGLQASSGGNGSTSSIGKTTEYRRVFNLEYRIEEQHGEYFDEANFLNKLKLEIADKIGAAGLKNNGAGTSGDIFYFDYSEGGHKGWIEVVGARLEGNKYKLWCVARESVGAENDD